MIKNKWDIAQLKAAGIWERERYVSAEGLTNVVANLEGTLLGDKRMIIGLEIGVASGWNMAHFLEHIPNLLLIGIDPYIPYMDWNSFISKEMLDAQYEAALNNIDPYDGRGDIVVSKSIDEVPEIGDDGCLDYVFIDGDHSYEGALLDMNLCYPKVKSGGIFSGHDYTLPDVNRALTNFKHYNLIMKETILVDHNAWYWIKE